MSQYNVNPTTQNVPSDVATTYATIAGNATPAANIITFTGAGGITFSASGSTVTATAGPTIPTSITTNSGTATPSGNVLQIIGGTNIQTSGASSTVTIRADIVTYIQPGAYPYAPTSTDYFISVDTSVPRTIKLPNAPVTGKTYIIKDRTGGAGIHNITVTTVGGVVLIDGQAVQTMNDNFESLQIIFNGTSYEIF